jgi:hypothetical protein
MDDAKKFYSSPVVKKAFERSSRLVHEFFVVEGRPN